MHREIVEIVKNDGEFSAEISVLRSPNPIKVDPRLGQKLKDRFSLNFYKTCTSGQNRCTKSSYENFLNSTPFWPKISTFFKSCIVYFFVIGLWAPS